MDCRLYVVGSLHYDFSTIKDIKFCSCSQLNYQKILQVLSGFSFEPRLGMCFHSGAWFFPRMFLRLPVRPLSSGWAGSSMYDHNVALISVADNPCQALSILFLCFCGPAHGPNFMVSSTQKTGHLVTGSNLFSGTLLHKSLLLQKSLTLQPNKYTVPPDLYFLLLHKSLS